MRRVRPQTHPQHRPAVRAQNLQEQQRPGRRQILPGAAEKKRLPLRAHAGRLAHDNPRGTQVLGGLHQRSIRIRSHQSQQPHLPSGLLRHRHNLRKEPLLLPRKI